MGQPSFWQRVREWIAGIAFGVYLRASNLTADKFHQIWQEQILGELNEVCTPPLRYWQHEETGRVCARVLQPGELWYAITHEQYDNIVRDITTNA